VKVITANTFGVELRTNKVNLLGTIRDHDADGDLAHLRIDEGVDINNNGTVDFRTPGTTTYGFEPFAAAQPGYNTADNNGTFTQTINTTNLSEGYHYLTARAYRHRASGPEIFTDFKQAIYVDRLKPVSAVNAFAGVGSATATTRDLTMTSTDQTATSVNVFLDLPANLSDAEILAMVGQANSAGQIDARSGCE